MMTKKKERKRWSRKIQGKKKKGSGGKKDKEEAE